MSQIFRGFDSIRVYISNLFIITKGDWPNHLEKLELRLQKLKDNGLKCNIKKSFFAQTEMEYLVFWVTQTGIWPINWQVGAIVNMTLPDTTKYFPAFRDIVNYYRDLWARLSHLLNPLTALTSSNVQFKWTATEQKAFDGIKRAVT